MDVLATRLVSLVANGALVSAECRFFSSRKRNGFGGEKIEMMTRMKSNKL